MTPKEKAKELYAKFNPHVLQRDFFGDDVEKTKSKICALIAVDEMLKVTPKYFTDELLTPKGSTDVRIPNCTYEYLQEVKQEIELL